MNEFFICKKHIHATGTCGQNPMPLPSFFFFFFFLSTSTPFHINNTLQPPMHHCMTHIQQIQSNSSFHPCRASDMIQARRQVTLPCLHWGTCCAFIPNLVNKKGPPVWKLANSFSVYITLPENTHQYLFTAADNSPWNTLHSRSATFRRHPWKLESKPRKCDH